VFEPDPENYKTCVSALGGMNHVHFHPFGLFNKKDTLRFVMCGSASLISEKDGDCTVRVEALDDLSFPAPPTLIKMDIEGAEIPAIEGGRQTILAHHPSLAIAAYHCAGDFWRIPRAVLSICEDYDVYMRHYTEYFCETVLFFILRHDQPQNI
jgi:FkbM family methyltransferase